MRLGQSAVESKSLFGRILGLGDGFRWRQDGVPIRTSEQIRVRQSRVSQGVIRIVLDRLLKTVKALLNPLYRPLIPKKSTLQIELIRLAIIGIGTREAKLFVAAQTNRQSTSNLPRDRVLHRKHIGELLINGARPKYFAIAHTQESNRNTSAIA